MSHPRRNRPSEFLLPDGRKVLVALPSDIEALRQRHARSHDADPPTQVEVVVHGSDEHRHFLGLTKSHHETRRAQLRERIGADVVEELEAARAQLDSVSAQLERLEAAAAAQGSGLGANFEKFGFDAKVRTYADDSGEDGLSSSRVSLASVGAGESFWEGGRRGDGDALRLFRRPIIKQYFHRGLLWRASEHTEVLNFELFFDLLYVGIIAINGDHALEDPTGLELLRFVVTFLMTWKIWSDIQQIISWFETNDIAQRIQILFLMALLLGVTTNMLQTFHGEQDSFTQLVTFYLAARLFGAIYCVAVGIMIPLVKGMMVSIAVNVVVGAALWIASTHLTPDSQGSHSTLEHRATEPAATTEEAHGGGLVAQHPGRLALIFIALGIDLFGSMIPVFMFRYGRSHTTPIAKRFGRWFEFFPAINIEHKVERTNMFITLVLGYSVVAMIFQNTGAFVLNAFLGKAFLGLTQAFIFNWLYFEVDGSNIRTHAIRWRVEAAFLWQNAHLVFTLSYILAAAAMCKLVVITDCPNAPFSALTPFYQHRSDDHISTGLRLYYCIGLGLALFSMGLISLSHEHRVPLGTCKLPKWLRLTNRFLVCIIFFALPAAGDRLNSLALVSITTSLSAWTLFFELYGKTCKFQPFFTGGDDQGGRCEYTAKCSEKTLERAKKDDGEIDIVELGRAEKTAVVTATS
ncbi:hypothetical protein QBC34DRAFT_485330 [Podospora aff. communis PSN243]|uniref:Uncharacterized protein n=1 Tax=Podospora aff. communis PSN243 TaxID=3040156 RepID=A0AAV9GLP0_9PEZI|nr:hypothetical protein QBC34DRAFT_485330 [Podospora aff. communis PSN243]